MKTNENAYERKLSGEISERQLNEQLFAINDVNPFKKLRLRLKHKMA